MEIGLINSEMFSNLLQGKTSVSLTLSEVKMEKAFGHRRGSHRSSMESPLPGIDWWG